MSFDIKALIKVLSIFIGLSAIVVFLVSSFGFPHFLFEKEISEIKKKCYPFAALAICFTTSLIGQKMAAKGKRNQNKWALICFFLNVWGLLYLFFLPSITKTGDGSSPK